MWSSSLGTQIIKMFWSQRINHNLTLQIPNLNLLVGSSTQPVTIWREAEGVDDFSGVKTVESLSLVQIPKHGGSVLSSRGTEGSIRRHTYGVDVSGVSNEVIAKLAVGQRPNFDKPVPSTTHNEWNLYRRTETYAGNPLRVRITGIISRSALRDGVFALSKGIPKLNGLITTSRNNLTVVHRKRHREHILGMLHESPRGLSAVDLPKTESSVPGSGKGELSIGTDDYVGYEVVVAAEGTLCVSTGVVFWEVGLGSSGETPYHDGFVTGGGEDEVWVFLGCGDGCYPVIVAGECSAKSECFGHGGGFAWVIGSKSEE